MLMLTGSGMAAGGWLAGVVYDYARSYAAAFAFGIAVNALHVVVVASLVMRRDQPVRSHAALPE